MSGAGKSSALKALEDLGYYCVDNILPALIPELAMTFRGRKIAVSCDSRSGDYFDGLNSVLDLLKINNLDYGVLFLDAEDETLINRYQESRRAHPLESGGRVGEAIARERKLTAEIRAAAAVIDTTGLSVKELKQKIFTLFGSAAKNSAEVSVISFGFKRGAPRECDMLFDVRFLPNPHNNPELKFRNGLEKTVKDYVFAGGLAEEFVELAGKLILKILPEYLSMVKIPLLTGIGCTGGKHRSVAVTERLAEGLRASGVSVNVVHRDVFVD